MPKKPVQVIVRVSEEEREAWKSSAAATGRTLSEWLRDLANLTRGGGTVDSRSPGSKARVPSSPKLKDRVPQAMRGLVERAGSIPAPATKSQKQMPDGLSNSEAMAWHRKNRT